MGRIRFTSPAPDWGGFADDVHGPPSRGKEQYRTEMLKIGLSSEEADTMNLTQEKRVSPR